MELAGQWCRRSVHWRADAGRAPSSGSVAPPAKKMVSPTFHVAPPAGRVIVAWGGRLSAKMEIPTVEVAPAESRTMSLTLCSPVALARREVHEQLQEGQRYQREDPGSRGSRRYGADQHPPCALRRGGRRNSRGGSRRAHARDSNRIAA